MESEYRFFEGFIKDHLSIANSVIRELRVKRQCSFLVSGIQLLTIKSEDRYSKTSFIDGEELTLASAYVGKKGDVIFTFSVKERAGVVAEIKMSDARAKLSGFEKFVIKSYGEKATEHILHAKAIEQKLELEKQKELERKIENERAAKAAKYANKPYGAW